MSEKIQKINEEKSGQTIIINQQEAKSNGAGVAGFILALIGLFFGWIPFFGWILWLLGLIFSIIGVFKKPKGFAIAGLVISLIGVLFLLVLAAAFFSTSEALSNPDLFQ